MPKSEPGKPAAPWEGTVLWHFVSCWRGECGIRDAFLASVIVFAGINGPLVLLRQYAIDAGWPHEIQAAVSMLRVIGGIFVAIWVIVSMWRSARRDFLRGQRFWPIVTALIVAMVATTYVSAFVIGLMDSLMRSR
jgi:hypothetical protein